ncbi:MAG: DegT/DnrJ/EryC1/StrS family aminotransferase [Bacteroidia bacterium]|nr:DegT/DnrJ/EryC1/StrS family aminotransferase [Bacteroidia bacterium]
MIPFSPPRIDQKIIDEVVDTLKSGWITTGPKTKKFEKLLAEYCGNKRTICLNSATAGLEIMLIWFGVKEGDEVILPSYTYSATANVIMHCGAKPVFVDVKSDFNIDPEKVKAAITSRTKVIMPVDFGGWPCDYNALNALVNDPEIKNLFSPVSDEQKRLGRIFVLADAAHSLGAKQNGNKSGTLTDCSVFSFHAVKNLTTAEGGAVALNFAHLDNDKLYDELCVKTLHGQNKDALAKMQKGNWRYDIVEAGYKMNMTDILAAIGLVELERYESETLVKRKAICQAYNKAFGSKSWAILPDMENSTQESSYHLYPLRISGIDEAKRDKIMQQIFDKDISVNVHFIPVPMMSFYKSRGYSIEDYPVCYRNYSCEISLPVFFDLTFSQIEQISQSVIQSVEEELYIRTL